MTDQDTVAQVHDLLARNYVEDDDEMFRWTAGPASTPHAKHTTAESHQV